MESWGAKARTMQAELELLVLGLCTASAISCSDAPSCSRLFEIVRDREFTPVCDHVDFVDGHVLEYGEGGGGG